jgi:hypothetical protein
MENLRLDPPAPIVQVRAEDLDEGKNSAVKYSIMSGNEGGEYAYYILYSCISVYYQFSLQQNCPTSPLPPSPCTLF